MKKILLIGLALLLTLPLSAGAATYEIFPKVSIKMPDLPPNWVATTEAPAEMVEHIAEHVKEEAEAQGKTLSNDKAMELAKKRLQAEELFLYNTKSEAHITISFEAMGADEKAPTQKDITLSAKMAASGVGDEGWENVVERYPDLTVKGADAVQLFEMDYTHEGEKGRFTGVVGFADPFWFWVYGTDHMEDPNDKKVIKGILEGMEIIRK